MIAALGRDLKTAARTFVDREKENERAARDEEQKLIEKELSSSALIDVALDTSGDLRRMDTDAACSLAKRHDLRVAMRPHPGQFVLAGTPILTVRCLSGSEELDNDLRTEICSLISVGERRTPEASVEFEISALVEVALRALSPGINDSFTACACIDRLERNPISVDHSLRRRSSWHIRLG